MSYELSILTMLDFQTILWATLVGQQLPSLLVPYQPGYEYTVKVKS